MNFRYFLLVLTLLLTFSSFSQDEQTFKNPILAGWYPDPAITDDGNGNYYMVHSTFAFYPGIPIFHSTDLVNWEQIGNVLDRPEQVDLEGFGVSRAVFAPDISFDNGTFYVTCTIVDGQGNFVVTAKDPTGSWSNPVWLPEVKGIDPGLFFDEEKSYIVYNSDAPNNQPKYEGHRTIRMYEFDKENLRVTGESRILVDGGVDISKEPIWAEGPRIYKLRGYYYLMTAEGGTAINHEEVIYRNKDINEEFIPYENNPILTQKHLDPNRENPITSAGHADITQHPNGDWYGIFLAVRPYEGDHYNTGRETFLAPVKWENDWPVFDLEGEEIKYEYPLPDGVKINEDLFPLNGNFSFTKEFDTDELDLHWLFLRTVKEDWYSLTEKPGFLLMETRPETISGKSNPSFVSHRQQHLTGFTSVSLDFTTNKSNEQAGLVAFQNETNFYFIARSIKNGSPVVELIKGSKDGNVVLETAELNSGNENIKFKMEFDKDEYQFFYNTNGKWMPIGGTLDGKYLSTRVAGGFVGVVLGMYTTSNGELSDNHAAFDHFQYTGKDEIYKN